MAIVVCRVAARRRIQGKDTGEYTPVQKDPTIIELGMVKLSLSESLTVSTGNLDDYFQISKMPSYLRE